MIIDLDKLGKSANMAFEAYNKVNKFEKRLDALEKNTEKKHSIKVKEFFVIEDLDEVRHNIEEYLGEFFTDGRLEAADDIVRIIKGEDVSIP